MPTSMHINCYIGKSSLAASPMLDATVDDFRIYADVLQETEVVELLREGQSLTLTHWYEFETANMTADSSGRGNTLIASNIPTHTTSRCKVGAGCAFLDNSGPASLSTNAYFSVPEMDSSHIDSGISFRFVCTRATSHLQSLCQTSQSIGNACCSCTRVAITQYDCVDSGYCEEQSIAAAELCT
eukprot:319191-Rhodomonas_salina.1